MSNETEFVNGLIVKAPNENAPEYVKAKLSIKRAELIAWLQARPDEWVNAEVKVSQNGKWYVSVDSWRPQQGSTSSRPQREVPQRADTSADFDDESIPF